MSLNCINNTYSKGTVDLASLAQRETIKDDLSSGAGLKSSLLEAIGCIALLAIVSPYMPEEDRATAQTITSSVFATCLIVRQLAVYFQEEIKSNGGVSSIPALVNDYAPPLLLNIPFKYLNSLAHEYGHYAAIRYADNFDNSSLPVVNLHATFGGNVTYINTPARRINDTMITAAGPIAQITFAAAAIAVAHFSPQRSFSKIFLNAAASFSILGSLNYAYSAFAAEGKSSHDFAVLWDRADIHPYLAMICIVALPLIVKAGLLLNDYYLKHGEIPYVDKINSTLKKICEVFILNEPVEASSIDEVED